MGAGRRLTVAIRVVVALGVPLPATGGEHAPEGPAPGSVRAVPPGRAEAAMAYDAARRQVVLFGGLRLRSDFQYEYLADTWVWDGVAWTRKQPPTSPPARSLAGMAYDAARSEVVLFGGNSPNGFLGDTWTWNGTIWTQKAPATEPSPRAAMGIAYDHARRQVVLFGGNETSFFDCGVVSFPSNETWLWDGTTWTMPQLPAPPPGRCFMGMDYEVFERKVVLFGGYGQVGSTVDYLSDTWIWNGTAWFVQDPPSHPNARGNMGMAYDGARRESVLFGGYVTDFIQEEWYRDTWSWNGPSWTSESQSGPSPRQDPAMAFDLARRNVVLFGGFNGNVIGNCGFTNCET